MAEDLGTIRVTVEDLGGASGPGGGSAMPRLRKPSSDGNEPAKDAKREPSGFQRLWRDIGPSVAALAPRSASGLVQGVGRMAAAAAPAAVIAATVALAVAAIAAFVAAVAVATKVLLAWRNQTLAVARTIGNIDSRIASANAGEAIASVNRRFSMAAAQGQYAALAVTQDTALKDALTGLSNVTGPLKAMLSGVLTELLTAIVRVLTDILKAIGQWFTAIFGSMRQALAIILPALARFLDLVGGPMAMAAGANEALMVALLAQMDAKLAGIQRNTRPAGMRRANAWAIGEARAFGGRNW